jgi:hypothetical protein
MFKDILAIWLGLEVLCKGCGYRYSKLYAVIWIALVAQKFSPRELLPDISGVKGLSKFRIPNSLIASIQHELKRNISLLTFDADQLWFSAPYLVPNNGTSFR